METRKKKSFKRLFAFLMAFVMVSTLAVSAVFAAPTFSDVPASHEFYEYIEFLFAEGVVKGYGSTGKYGPEDLLTRAQAAKMIAFAAGYEDNDGSESKFTDVDKGTDMAAQIWALEKAGVVKGFGQTNEYRPDTNITRGHVAKIVALAFELTMGDQAVTFTDLPKDDPGVAEAIRLLASNGIVSGYKGTTLFKPDEPVTRGQFAKIVAGALLLTPIDIDTVAAMEQTLATGDSVKFLVNGREFTKESFLKIYDDAYTITFYTDTTGAIDDNGKVAVAFDGESFKYSVELTDKEDATIKIPENAQNSTNFKKITVIDPKVAIKVNGLGLYTAIDPEDVEFKGASVTTADKVEIQASVWENGFGKTNKITGLSYVIARPIVELVESSNTDVAYYEGGKIVVDDGLKKATKVTFTVTFKDIKDKSTITVTVAPGQEIGGVKVDPDYAKVQAELADVKVHFILLDKLGEPYRLDVADTALFYTVTKAGATEVATATGVAATNGESKIQGNWEAAKYTVKLYSAADRAAATTVSYGSFTFEAFKVVAGELTYVLSFADDDATELELNEDGTNALEELDVEVRAFTKDGVLVNNQSWTDFTLVANKEKMVEVGGITGAGVGTATINLHDDAVAGVVSLQLVETTGTMKTDHGSPLAVKIVDKYPKIETLVVIASGGVLKVKVSSLSNTIGVVKAADLVGLLTAGKDDDGNELFTAARVESVQLIERIQEAGVLKGTLKVKILDVNGGKTFTFTKVEVTEGT